MAGRLKKEKQKIYLSQGNLKKKMIPRIFFMAYLGINVIVLTGIPVYASDIFATAKNAMQTVYTDVAGIATVAAVVCAAVCLFLMNFSKKCGIIFFMQKKLYPYLSQSRRFPPLSGGE